jgi:hypothetical protein
MASNTDLLKQFFLDVVEGLRKDAEAKGQKFPIDKLRFEADEISGRLYAPHYVQYLFTGRGPGKQPPPDVMTDWAERNPDILERARQVYRNITAQQLGFLVGRKIAREGTDIYSCKRPGIDFLGVVDENMPQFMKDLAKNELIKIATELRSAINQVPETT